MVELGGNRTALLALVMSLSVVLCLLDTIQAVAYPPGSPFKIV